MVGAAWSVAGHLFGLLVVPVSRLGLFSSGTGETPGARQWWKNSHVDGYSDVDRVDTLRRTVWEKLQNLEPPSGCAAARQSTQLHCANHTVFVHPWVCTDSFAGSCDDRALASRHSWADSWRVR